MQINLFESIRIFIEIVEAGSFTQAAENLRIHRPAVTKALQLLEQHCGTRLMQRTTRRIDLTPDGEAFYRRSKPLLAQADELLESISSERVLHGQLRVDMPIALAALLVIPRLPEFYSKYPDIEIVLSSSDRRRDMLRDGLDCILRVGELDDSDYVPHRMGNIKMTTCASPGYIALHGMPETLENLRDHQAINWVNSNSRRTMPWTFTTPEGTREMTLSGKLVVDNSEAYVAAGLAGLGLVQGMNVFLKPYLDSGQLVEVLPGNPSPDRKLTLLYPHRHLSHKVRVFTEWLERLL
ncbi:LysR family transcriptional regulator [Enterobacter huaxiensis]|uniref:LysR family transcriptional regulator n=1 Tax=Enterobacter huaxiensis TaxID=2494702 RepID=A0A428LV14_9ENTR|nr:LysR family transcriptional regulator [Enterobacter huaxiensis]MEB7541591.1 LysR family transcriptional regulator [Enterobacter huaxiensis]MEB7580486.1 LysR family transcriptional regulator [Enterobacter huaxiensis]MEB7661316.1 LysR family transcriptional regulator [Enterobacter huaxiensis]RSK69195.1 LysR family transcriptional regulator [Enterobacter huaxiensis]